MGERIWSRTESPGGERHLGDEGPWSRWVLGSVDDRWRTPLRVGLLVGGWAALAVALWFDVGSGLGLLVATYGAVALIARSVDQRTPIVGSFGERGAALVEFALILPLLAALLLGTLTAGIAYDRNNSLNNAARESARYGATLPVDTTMAAWLTAIAAVAEAGATGALADDAPGQRICVAYVHPDGTAANDRTSRLVEVGGVQTSDIGTPCFSDGRPSDERRVQIRVERTSSIEAIAFTSDVNLSAESVVRFEREG